MLICTIYQRSSRYNQIIKKYISFYINTFFYLFINVRNIYNLFFHLFLEIEIGNKNEDKTFYANHSFIILNIYIYILKMNSLEQLFISANL